MKAGKWRSSAYDMSNVRMLEQVKAHMTEQCAVEVEATKALLSEQLRREQKRHGKEIEERDRRAADYCLKMQTRYEEMLVTQESAFQGQFLSMKETIDQLLRTHISLEDHQQILAHKEEKARDEHKQIVQELKVSCERAAQDALHAQETSMAAAHQGDMAPLLTHITELQVKCDCLAQRIEENGKELSRQAKLAQEEKLRRSQAETKLQESCRHLLTLRNQLKKSAVLVVELKKDVRDARQRTDAARASQASLELSLVTLQAEHASSVKCLEQDIHYLKQHLAQAVEHDNPKRAEKIAALKKRLVESESSRREVEVREQLALHRIEQARVTMESQVARLQLDLAAADEKGTMVLATKDTLTNKVAEMTYAMQELRHQLGAATAAKEQIEASWKTRHAELEGQVTKVYATLEQLRKENVALKQELRVEQQLFKGAKRL
ncbi:Aste57867_9029 [Aphanomyces stellatus]|uniref:Aste57867_9029 protein n=1 Tax=Aphanomyces stellatus TaxID=120398 RepID=A0A485KLS8_9STRA|nr:hypothetical protein As57867_008993 [Aphanomyces stellatus]VFT85913.1 Aste57867_9029 [Aphanomyces stellatus]